MKKQFLLCLSVAVMLMVMCIGAMAAGEAVLEYVPNISNQVFTGSTDCVYVYNTDSVTVKSTNGPDTADKDPKKSYNGDVFGTVKMPAPFDGDANQWIKLRILNRSAAEVFEFHFASTATDGKVTGATCTHFPISANDTEYKEYIFNIKECNLASQNVNKDVALEESVWAGEISSVRFDFMWVAEPSGQVPNGSEMDIQYIGFFASEEDAKAHTFASANVDVTGEWDDSFAWVLNNTYNAGIFSASNCDTAIELGSLKVIPLNGDPMLTYKFAEGAALPNTDEYRYFALRLKTKSTVTNGALFVSTDVNTEFSGKAYNSFILSNTGEWQDVVIDMSTNAYWGNSNLTGFRLDPINALDLEADVYVERVGFFKTSGEAISFLGEKAEEFGETHFKGETHKAIVPSGILSEGYNKADYMLSNDVILDGTTSENLPVVYYTDANGNSSVVALCYSNPVGWTTYVANKAGKYTVAFNHKEYTDIAGHWGEKYINFVSDRTLFGGTSPTEFSPEETMTRGMFVTVLGRMHGVDTAKYDGNTGYADVPATEYYAPYIQWAKEIGIFAPVSETEFAPEAPITREVMAVVIANYVDAYNYSFVSNADPIEFNDISALSEASVNAIKAAQKAGIINGKGEGKFDPAGISTRAEVATVMQRVIKGILYIPTYNTTYTKDYFMRDRIRLGVWNFNANKFSNEESVKLLSELGADFIVSAPSTGNAGHREALLNLTDKYGIETYVMDLGDAYNDPNKDDSEENFITAADVNPIAITSDYFEHPSFTGTYIVDEPGMDCYDRLAEICNKYSAALPGYIPFINLLPMYASDAQLKYGANIQSIQYYDNTGDIYKRYCDEFCEKVDADYICTDIYPLNWAGSTKTTYKDYVESINQIATSAREHGKEFWCCIQTFDWTTGHSKRNPTEEEFRWQCYSMLSFGCTGILLWTYWSGNDETFAVVYNDGTPTENYTNAQPVMWEMRRLSDTFIQYQNLGAFTVNYSSAVPYLRMSNEYKDFTILSEITSADPLLVGCFEKKEGEGYAFTVVNMVEFREARGTEFSFKLAEADKKVTLHGKDDPTVLTAVDGVYTVALEEGQGVFITVE